MIFRIVHVGMIHHRSGAGINSLKSSAELAPEDINGLEARVGQVSYKELLLGHGNQNKTEPTRRHIIKERIVAMAPFELGLP